MPITIIQIFLIILALFSISCSNKSNIDRSAPINYRQEMRNFVQGISAYGKGKISNFIIIPQNGQEIITQNGEAEGVKETEYINSIDGAGREDLFYGYNNDNEPTPENEKNYMIAFLDLCEENSIEVLTIDYCSDQDKIDDSYSQNYTKNYISFAAPDRALNIIPDYPNEPFNRNSENIQFLADASNFLYLINPENFPTKEDFISAVSVTDYDLIIMDYFFNNEKFTASEIENLKTKNNGGSRLLISYMSIGEAEDYRYYWKDDWKNNPPNWLEQENPNWKGNYKVRYWNQEWQSIIFGSDNSYLDMIIDAGFDGVYLDIIDAFEYFEN